MPTVVDDATFERMLGEVMPPELEAELELFKLGEVRRTMSQEMKIDSNWKLPVDTFCESYHFQKLHPGLREQLMPNTSVFRTFEPSDPDGLKRSSCMTLGSVQIRLLAAGLQEEDWGPPLRHVTQVYHLAPNTVLLLGGGGGATLSQHWPAGSAGQCTAELSQWSRTPPRTGERSKAQMKAGFGFLMDLFVGEDFQILPKMHQNFATNPDMEIMIGRHEPCLADRHRFYSEALARDAEYAGQYAEHFAEAFAGGGGGGK